MAAEAIHWASLNERRELFVAPSTLQAVYGNRILPGLLDEYLAQAGYSGQQTDEPADPDRPYNLWHPVEGDHGAHGAFDRRARGASVETWFATRGQWLALAGAGLAGMAWGALAGNGRASADDGHEDWRE